MLDETDAQALAVQIGRKIEQVGLDRPLVFAERRVNADVGDTRNLSLSDGDDHRIHAIGEEYVRARSQVRCREPEAATALEAFFHPPAHGVGTTQQAGHFTHLAGTEQGTYRRTADFAPLNQYGT